MAAIKSNIIKRWDTASTGVRTCCIKFVQKVVFVQTPGVIADPRVRDPRVSTLCQRITSLILSSAQIKTKYPWLLFREIIP